MNPSGKVSWATHTQKGLTDYSTQNIERPRSLLQCHSMTVLHPYFQSHVLMLQLRAFCRVSFLFSDSEIWSCTLASNQLLLNPYLTSDLLTFSSFVCHLGKGYLTWSPVCKRGISYNFYQMMCFFIFFLGRGAIAFRGVLKGSVAPIKLRITAVGWTSRPSIKFWVQADYQL